MESLVYSEGLDGRNVERSMHQLAKEEKWGYLQEDRAFIDSIVEGKPAAGDRVRWVQIGRVGQRGLRIGENSANQSALAIVKARSQYRER